jgi:hypothetical protein
VNISGGDGPGRFSNLCGVSGLLVAEVSGTLVMLVGLMTRVKA